MINATGMDIQRIDEIALSLDMFGTRYTSRLFTNDEVEHCQRNVATRARCYAERFAAKEAVLKLLNVRDVVPSWKDIEVRGDSMMGLGILLRGVAADLARLRGIQGISLDISRVHDVVIAVALAGPAYRDQSARLS